MEILENKKKLEIRPTQITIDISGNCNSRCPFCLRQLSKSVPKGYMNKKIFYNIIEQVKEIKSIKIISLAAYGEPLLHPDFDEFINYLSELKYNILITTNMSLAHKHFDSLLKATHIIYSIEGYDKNSYEEHRKNLSFDNILTNVKEFDRLVKEKRKEGASTPSRMINFVLTKKSKTQKFYNLWRQYVDLIMLNLMVNPLSWDNNLKIFINKKVLEFEKELVNLTDKEHAHFCTEPFKTIVIHPNGKLALCCIDANCSLDFGDYRNIKINFYENKNINDIRSELIKKQPIVCQNCKSNSPPSRQALINYFPELSNLLKKYILKY